MQCGLVAFIALQSFLRVASGKDLETTVDRIQLHQTSGTGGGRVYLKGKATAVDQRFKVEWNFPSKLWNANSKATPGSTLDVREVDWVNVDSISWTLKEELKSLIDPDSGIVTVTASVVPTKAEDVSLSFQILDGGWDLEYGLILPNPAKETPAANFDVLRKLTLKNESGMEWPAETSVELLADKGDTKPLEIEHFSGKVPNSIPTHNSSKDIKLSPLAVSGKYELKASGNTKGKQPTEIYLTLDDDFPKAGLPVTLKFWEKTDSQPKEIVSSSSVVLSLKAKKATDLGPSAATITVARTDTEEAIGLVQGVVSHRTSTKLEVSSSLKVPVTLTAVCGGQSCCNSATSRTLDAAKTDPSTLTVEFKSAATEDKGIINILATSSGDALKSQLAEKLDFMKSVAPRQVSECTTPSFQSDLNMIQQELTYLSKMVDASSDLENTLTAVLKATTDLQSRLPDDPNVKLRMDFDQAGIRGLVEQRNAAVERYNKRVSSLKYLKSTCCDVLPPAQP